MEDMVDDGIVVYIELCIVCVANWSHSGAGL